MLLVVGDGDHSFAHSLLTAPGIPASQLVALACEESPERLAAKYPQAEANVAALQAAGARIYWGVDVTAEGQLGLKRLARRLEVAPAAVPRISRIVFNFPHTGEGIKDRDHNIRAQQKLILHFLTHAARLLQEQHALLGKPGQLLTRSTIRAMSADDPSAEESKGRDNKGEGGEEYEGEEEEYEYDEDAVECRKLVGDKDSKANGQRSNDESAPHFQQAEIHLTTWGGDPYDCWDVKRLAASTGVLTAAESFVFEADRYPGYQHCRTAGFVKDDAHFAHRPARTFVFTLTETSRKPRREPLAAKKHKASSSSRSR